MNSIKKKKEIANMKNNKQDMLYFFNNENHEQTDMKIKVITNI